MNKTTILITFILSVQNLNASVIKIENDYGKNIPTVMVTQKETNPIPLDVSDDGYQKPNQPRLTSPEVTRFSDQSGVVNFNSRKGQMTYRVRKVGYKDSEIIEKKENSSILHRPMIESDQFKLAEAMPANVWLGALEIGNLEDKSIFKMQCGFCHQLGTEFIRQERNTEEWRNIIKRMVRYGSRLPSDLQESLPDILVKSFKKLRENPGLLQSGSDWGNYLSKVTITEWPIGDSMSQTHDMLVGRNKLVYVADNIQDRLYEVNPLTNEVSVFKIPHVEGDVPGGLISARLKEFPKHDSTSNAHSLAESKIDGHIFITPSAQRRLVEFDPVTKKFILHQMDQGFYPHTIRIDQNDDVWFTLALSNQVAKFNRKKKKFTYYDLPARSFKERLITKNIGILFKLMSWGLPISNLLKIDRDSTGVPLVYGIDITPDGMVWVARLHTKEIGCINPKTGKINMITTPFLGPRRLRTDGEGNLWIVSYGESKIGKYNPIKKKFSVYDIPVKPIGSETPYSLNVDIKRNNVWVTGNQSDSLHIFDIKNETWRSVPLPRRTTFTRDVEFDEEGNAYTSNSNFPSWHIEDSQPTLIRIEGIN